MTESGAVQEDQDNQKTKLAWSLLAKHDRQQEDAEEAVKLLEEQVCEGDSEAMWMLGLCKEFGMGTEQDCDEAKKLYEKSHAKDDALSTSPSIGSLEFIRACHFNMIGTRELGFSLFLLKRFVLPFSPVKRTYI